MILGLRMITPVGVLDLGRVAASAAGPDLRQLAIGSEGAFGVITKVRLRVHRIPETTRYEAWSFPDFTTGVAALRAVTQTGTGPTVVRLSDEAETGVNLATTESIGESQITGGCLGLTLFEGTKEHAESRHAETRALLTAHGGTSLGEGRRRPGSEAGTPRPTCATRCWRPARCARHWRPPPTGPTSRD
ncbi:FAD linked oxidase, C-terminal domain protein [Mycobacterium kansasii 824]|nr:FAD linked oxidase, C-terminal domain protein [Mycobacterium kansasii 824]